MIVILKLLVAHLLGDLVRCESSHRASRTSPLRKDILNGVLFASVAILLFLPGTGGRVWIGIAVATVLRWLLSTARRLIPGEPDQMFVGPIVEGLRASFVALVAAWMAGGTLASVVASLLSILSSTKVLLYVLAYVSVVLGGGRVVQWVTRRFLTKVEETRERPGLPEAGRYIGWLERFLIVTFVALDYGEAVGFLLAAKALVRYPEIQEDKRGHFAEYFLIGTLTSVGLAILGGVILRYLAPLA